jgi:serine O-acetyltransferase
MTEKKKTSAMSDAEYFEHELNELRKYCRKASASLDEGLTRVARAARKTVKAVKDDVRATRERDPAARSDLEVLLLYPGVHALLAHRVAHKLHENEHYFSARAISQAARLMTGIEIHPGAKIGKGLMIDHGMGVVIGETAVIGDNCTIYQGVTLGGTGKDVGKRHPTLGNNVMVGAGAKVLGPFTIGDNTKIAANAVVLTEMPDNCTAVGIPAKVVKREGMRVDDLDQVHIPDPVAQEISKLEARLRELEAQIAELNAKK